jgi:hypothetical protein
VPDWPRQSWVDAEPRRYERERAAMAAIAPELDWFNDERGTGWHGIAPLWPFQRADPPHLDAFLGGWRFRILVQYLEGFPMAAPLVWPVDPQPDPRHRMMHIWHVNPNGSLCLMQSAGDWTGDETAADLVVKGAAWFLEYLLMSAGAIETMTANGIVTDDSLDHLLTPETAEPRRLEEA